MTIQTDTNRVVRTGTGAQTEFDFDFKYFNDADINVTIDGTLINSDLYTITANSSGEGGTITFDTAPDDGAVILIYRLVDYTQESKVPNADKLGRGLLENMFDKLTMLAQQLNENVGRCIALSITSTSNIDLTLPEPVAGRALMFNSDGDGLTTSDEDVNEISTAASASAASAAASAAAAAVSEDNAGDSSTSATASAAAAAASATAAAASETAAAASETAAAASEANAATAETNAETAQAAAETAKTAAETAESNAETAQTAAETAQTAAEAAQAAAETAESNAETAATNAAASETAAAASAAAAALSAAEIDLPDPTGHGGQYIRQKTDITGFEYRTQAQMQSDVGVADDSVTTSKIVDGNVTESKLETGLISKSYIILQDQKASSTSGGSFTSGAWRTRDLNTEVADTGNICTLSSNQFALPAGTYRLKASAPAGQVDNHQARLQNITDGTTVASGTSERMGGTSASNRSFIETRFTIADTKTFEIQHRCGTTSATNGFGFSTGGFAGVEVYTQVEIWKEV